MSVDFQSRLALDSEERRMPAINKVGRYYPTLWEPGKNRTAEQMQACCLLHNQCNHLILFLDIGAPRKHRLWGTSDLEGSQVFNQHTGDCTWLILEPKLNSIPGYSISPVCKWIIMILVTSIITGSNAHTYYLTTTFYFKSIIDLSSVT